MNPFWLDYCRTTNFACTTLLTSEAAEATAATPASWKSRVHLRSYQDPILERRRNFFLLVTFQVMKTSTFVAHFEKLLRLRKFCVSPFEGYVLGHSSVVLGSCETLLEKSCSQKCIQQHWHAYFSRNIFAKSGVQLCGGSGSEAPLSLQNQVAMACCFIFLSFNDILPQCYLCSLVYFL